MALLDHFHPPASRYCGWQSVHTVWAAAITKSLNLGGMPKGFVAAPLAKLATALIEVDVATFENSESSTEGNGGVITAVYAPPKPRIACPATYPEDDLFEVQVRRDDLGRELVAAVELISPANKDRPASREAFVAKCGGYLRNGISVVLVDIVTDRLANLHAELLDFLGAGEDLIAGGNGQLYAVAYRPTRNGTQFGLEGWPEVLTVGAELPHVPLWLAADLAVRLPLESTYLETCKTLVIPNK